MLLTIFNIIASFLYAKFTFIQQKGIFVESSTEKLIFETSHIRDSFNLLIKAPTINNNIYFGRNCNNYSTKEIDGETIFRHLLSNHFNTEQKRPNPYKISTLFSNNEDSH